MDAEDMARTGKWVLSGGLELNEPASDGRVLQERRYRAAIDEQSGDRVAQGRIKVGLFQREARD